MPKVNIKFKDHLNNFDKEFVQQKLDEGLTVKNISELVNIPPRRLGEMIKYFNLTKPDIKKHRCNDCIEGLYYVYRHRRLDDNSVFYIGIGNQPDFHRARTKFGRNDHWEKLVNKVGFYWEILAYNLDPDDAKELEVLLIEMYGRFDLKRGRLVNKTNGGDGAVNVKMNIKQREAISKRNSLGNNPRAKKIIDTKNKKVYNSIKEVAIDLNIAESTMRSYVNGSMNNKTHCIYLEDYTGKVVEPSDNLVEIPVLNMESGVFHYSVKEASDCYNIKTTTLHAYLKGKLKNRTSLVII